MFFNGDSDPNRKGRCPAQGMHEAQGFVFYLPHNGQEPAGQPGWRFCDKCFGMFFNDKPDFKGRCPAGDQHRAQGFPFVLPHDVSETVGQPLWRFCDKCFGMFFNGDSTSKGRCPAGDQHRAQGFLFFLPHRDFPNPSITIRCIRPIGQGRFIEVMGSGFEPNQGAQIIHELEFPGDTGGSQPPGAPRQVTSDSAGNLFDRIPITQDISLANVAAFDFGSGETARASTESACESVPA
jgi:hypothetical protein